MDSFTIRYFPSCEQSGPIHTFQEQRIAIIMEICPIEMKGGKMLSLAGIGQ